MDISTWKHIRHFIIVAALLSLWSFSSAQSYKYETVQGDPLNTRIYTLNNGLKVFLTVYKDEPRIQTYIPVKVGSKNDPAETTGLAHYFEHMMFKGTPHFGTKDWDAEQKLITRIDSLFEVYRVTTDTIQRTALYHIIDSISYEASLLAIPSEYDKMMKAIGSTGTNAGTSNDYTIYIENIPANQLENWAKVQADRFTSPVLRLFHTELETIYEEKNMSLTQDARRANEAMLSGLYPNHPYGQQTTLGTQEHLKNPSMKNIREFFKKYYVANNMAVVLSGDFDYDEAIKLVAKYFETLPSGDVPPLSVKPETPITQPVVKEVVGLEAEQVQLAFRIGLPANSQEIYILNMLDEMLCNRKAGLIDINLVQKQKVYSAFSRPYVLADNSSLVLGGTPKTDQTLDDVKKLLLEQIELLKQGAFDDWMLSAAINNMEYMEMKRMESNQGRAMWIAGAFMNDIPWEKASKSIDAYRTITKKDIVEFANKHLSNNYVVVYKRQGTPPEVLKMSKPPITPIYLNRDDESDFVKEIKNAKPKEIKPVFVDFNKEITKTTFKGAEVLYIQNKENQTFSLYYHFPMGTFNDLKLPIAIDYLDYLGTSKYTPEQIKQEFYKLACSFGIHAADEESYLYVSGLSENMSKALDLLEQLLADPQPNDEALKNVIDDILKGRTDSKARQNSVLNALTRYAEYGKERVDYLLSESELRAITSEELIAIIKGLTSYEHKILYYGTETPKSLEEILAKYHNIGETLKPVPAAKAFPQQDTPTDKLYYAHYDANQSRLRTYSRSVPFDVKLYPASALYNGYFGGSMNAIVFQEMREKRSLAYTAQSRFVMPEKADEYFSNTAFIATQNDKITDAFDAFNELFDEMPQSQLAFDLAKDALYTQIATNRITKMNIIWRYLGNQKLGIDYDMRRQLYDAIPEFTINDVATFNKEFIKGKPKTYLVLSKEEETDFEALKKYGEMRKLTLEEVFGY
ncbi:MAG: insulinase family protein [Bacteroidales bacterium]|nr:insulinase family protein [Bacteroidales bacterium]